MINHARKEAEELLEELYDYQDRFSKTELGFFEDISNSIEEHGDHVRITDRQLDWLNDMHSKYVRWTKKEQKYSKRGYTR